jgi:hypothetical protein
MRIYTSNLRNGLTQLASEPLQRRLWLATGGPEVGSFHEAVAQTYEDSGLSDVLDSPSVDKALGSELAELLRELAEAISSVETDRPVQDLIASPDMNRVRSLAEAASRAVEERQDRGDA